LELSYSLQRRLQDELIAARNEANTARQMKERFAANISHELRTPLNLILGFSDVMYVTPEAYGDFTWPPKLRRDIYQIHRSSKHLLEMIDDILDLSRQDMIDFTLHREATPLEALLRHTAEIVIDLFQDPAVRLEVVLAPDLPELEIDRTRIRQVVINLSVMPAGLPSVDACGLKHPRPRRMSSCASVIPAPAFRQPSWIASLTNSIR